jgi:ABC-2 type transport system ATP-binding protein
LSIAVSNVRHFYRRKLGRFCALDIDQLTLQSGITAVLGENGSGKSTFLSIASGRVSPSSGHITLDGEVAVDRRTEHKNAFQVAYHPQFPRMLGGLTIRELLRYRIALGATNPGASWEMIESYASELRVHTLLDAKVDSLSGGQRRKTAILCTFLEEAHDRLWDEPTSGLDTESEDTFFRLLASNRPPEATGAVATHNVRGIKPYCDYAVVFDKGTVHYSGPAEALDDDLIRRVESV